MSNDDLPFVPHPSELIPLRDEIAEARRKFLFWASVALVAVALGVAVWFFVFRGGARAALSVAKAVGGIANPLNWK